MSIVSDSSLQGLQRKLAQCGQVKIPKTSEKLFFLPVFAYFSYLISLSLHPLLVKV